ncbi:MAG: glycoside hydrolase [Thaumarchaeota archaeon]|nr:glycoside hydrolase [Nitrososphaerota archaeon]
MQVRKLSVLTIMALSLFLVSSVFASASYASGTPVFSTPKNLSNDFGSAIYPNVQNVGSHVYVVWTEGSGGIMFRSSPDGGSTWSPLLTSPAMKLSNKGGTTQYPLMSVNGSNVYVVWSQTINKVLQVFEATSNNSGSSFGKPVQLTFANTAGGYITPVIASWGSNIYVAYVNASNQASYVTCSTKAGVSGSWSPAFPFSTFHEPQLAAVKGNVVYAIADRQFQVSSNNCGIGAKSGDVNWTDVTPAVGIHAEPWLAVSGSNVYGIWETKHNTSNVEMMNSNDGGITWTPGSNLSSTLPDAWNPMIGSVRSSAWAAIQQYPGSSKSQIFIYTTTNGGTTWSSPTSLSGKGPAGSSTGFPFNVATTDGQNVFVAWSQQISSGYWVLRVGYSGDGGTVDLCSGN